MNASEFHPNSPSDIFPPFPFRAEREHKPSLRIINLYCAAVAGEAIDPRATMSFERL